jgi:predicted component of type VI protein secretion system
MERAGQLLELFASSFIESRRAHQRARLKLGLDKGGGNNVLTQSEDAHVLLAHLLEPSRSAQARSHELRRLLGDFAMHQIALLSAVVEGARSMLTELSPRAVTDLPDSAVDSSVLDQDRELANVWPFAAQKLWRKYMVRHNDLTLQDHFARELFGREFTRRYHAIADSASHVAANDRGDKT